MIAPSFQNQASTSSLAQAAVPQEDLQRREDMRMAWEAYRGRLPDPLKVQKNQPNDNVKSNRLEAIVNKGVSFLSGQVLKIEATDELSGQGDDGTVTTSKKSSPVQDFINGLWGDDDDKMTLLSKIAINGGVCGQCFAKLIPAQDGMSYPRIVNLDPRNVRIVTDPEDCDLHLAYIIEYPGGGDFQKRQIIARIDPNSTLEIWGNNDPDDHWTITNYMRRGASGVWLQVGVPEEWPYPFAPIFTCQNLPNPNEPWGTPDLTPDLIGQNKVLNFVQSNTSRIIKYHAHPKTWGKGFKAAQISVGIDDTLIIESMDGTLQNLEMHSDLHSSLAFIAVIRDNMDEQSRVPSVALGRLESLPRGTISGVALELLFQPLIEKTIQKRRLYGEFIRAITRAALVLTGLITVEQYRNYKIGLKWANLLPIDNLTAAQTAQVLLAIGVSESTVLAALGYDAVEEAKKKMKEDALKPKLVAPPAPTQPDQQQPGQPSTQQPAQSGQGQAASGGQR